MRDLIEELENNKKINNEKHLDNKVDIDYILERLKDINIYEEYILREIEYNIEEMLEDYTIEDKERENLLNLTKEDIKYIYNNIGYNDYGISSLNREIQCEIKKLIEE